MGIHLCFLLFLQTVWCSFTGAFPRDNAQISMSYSILGDHLAFHSNKVIHSIWQQEPAGSCNIVMPPETMLTDKKFLQFNFAPYLCVILYDTTLRYLNINSSRDNSVINSDIAEEIIKEFLPDTFCQKMKVNEWFTTIERNKLWVSSFNSDMKNSNSCQRYCVSDVVNPLCAYALWLDLRIKEIEHEFSHPSPANVKESRPPPIISVPHSKEQIYPLVGKSPHISNTHLSETQSSKLIPNSGEKRQFTGVSTERQTLNTTTKKDLTVPQQIPPVGQIVSSGQREHIYQPERVPYLISHIIPRKDKAEGRMPTGNEHENSEHIKTGNVASPNEVSLPVPGNTLDSMKTSNPLLSANHEFKSVEHEGSLSQSTKQLDKSVEHNIVQTPDIKENEERPEVMRSDDQRVSGGDLLENSKSRETLTVAQEVEEAPPVAPVSANAANSPLASRGEDHTVGQPLSGEHKTSTNLVEGYETISGGRSDASKIASPADSPNSQVPETPKIPEHSEDKTDKVRMNTTDPENDTKEVSGSTKGELTATKPPSLDQIGRSEPEAANQAIEGENDGKASGEPNDHEEQNTMDDGAAENGDSLGGHGGVEQPQDPDHEEAGIDASDQDFATEVHRYNEGDDEVPPRSDDSTKLSNNNNIDYAGGSDEDESLWPPAEQGRLPQNDADGGYAHDRFVDAEDSHFFAYFMTMIVLCIIGYLIFHNKQKILALALEGRVRKGTRRRPSTSGYRKLDSNLEEAVTSSCTGSSVTHVIY